MTREEAIIQLRLGPGINEDVSEKYNDAVNIAIEALQTPPITQRSMYQKGYAQGREEALKHERTDEWCDDCKEYDTKKKCCPRFNRVIRGALKREPSDDGTLEVKVEDATKVGRVLISDDEHRGGLYYPDEDEPQGISFENDTKIKSCSKDSDLISRAEVTEIFEAMLKTVTDQKIKIGISRSWQQIKDLPSADRPTDEFDGMIFSTDKYMAFIDKKEIHIMRKGAHKVTIERMFNTEEDEYKPMPKHGQSADRQKGGDLISRKEAIEALGEEPPVWCDEEYEIAERSQWRDDVEAIKSVPSADRLRGEWVNKEGIHGAVYCSECNYELRVNNTNFCPNCGADMRGDGK